MDISDESTSVDISDPIVSPNRAIPDDICNVDTAFAPMIPVIPTPDEIVRKLPGSVISPVVAHAELRNIFFVLIELL